MKEKSRFGKNKEVLLFFLITSVIWFFVAVFIPDIDIPLVGTYTTTSELDAYYYQFEGEEYVIEKTLLQTFGGFEEARRETWFNIYNKSEPYVMISGVESRSEINDSIKKPNVNLSVKKISERRLRIKLAKQFCVDEVELERTITNKYRTLTKPLYKYLIYSADDRKRENPISIFSLDIFYDRKPIEIKNIELLYSDDSIHCLIFNDYFTYKTDSGYGQRYVKNYSEKQIDQLVQKVKDGTLSELPEYKSNELVTPDSNE